MSATASEATSADAAALRTRLRAVTLGRLAAAILISVHLGTLGRGLVDPDGWPLLVTAGVLHVVVNLAALVLPERAAALRIGLEITTLVDAAALSVVLAVTGGGVSPMAPLVFAVAVALTLVFGWWTGVRAATLLSLGLLWVLTTSPPALGETVRSVGASDPTLALVLDPAVRVGLLLVGLWAVTGLVAALSGVTERELRRWLDDLGLLRDVTRELDPRRGVDTVCDALASTLTSRLGYRGAVVWLAADGRLRPVSHAGQLAVDPVEEGGTIATRSPSLARAIDAGAPTPVRRADPRPGALARAHGPSAPLVVLPLRTEGRLLGVVTVEVPTPLTGPPHVRGRDLRRLSLLADEAALLLDNARLQSELRSLSVTDALTGLPNHRFLQQRLGEEVDRLTRRATAGEARPLSVALFDLDRFKDVNDTYGHPTGDAVLQAVAAAAAHVLRSSDVVCRYGGEEFAVILVDTEAADAGRACERLADAIRALHVRAEDGRPLGRITASFGVATTVGAALDRAQLIAAADRALYAAKRGGRDRIVHVRDLPDAPHHVDLREGAVIVPPEPTTP